jgi:hypothetical protein
VTAVRRLGKSLVAVVGLTLLTTVLVVASALALPEPVIAVLAIVLTVGLAVVGRLRPGPSLGVMGLVGLLATFVAFLRHDDDTVWLLIAAAAVVCVGLVDEPLERRLMPQIRVTQLPGLPDDRRPQTLGPMADVVLASMLLFAVLLILKWATDLPDLVDAVFMLIVLAVIVRSVLRLRSDVRARRAKTVNRAVTEALVAYAPEFYIYFSGPVEADYQVRTWLPYLERLGVPYAVLARDPRMLARAASLTSRPVIACQRLAGLDDAMVPSVRALFYVNTNALCVDGVRYLDRTHVHLNHGDSDKPSSYHPMIAMFDQIFVAGQAAIDRFIDHGIVIPAEKFRIVGRPQVADITESNIDPVACKTVLYAPTWRGGVEDMTFSSLSYGEQLVRALIDRGVRVIFRPHPLSFKEQASSAAIARIDAVLAAARSDQTPHLASAESRHESLTDSFNRSDALVTDVSSVASDYLRSGKPMAVADLSATGAGQSADSAAYPMLRGAYLLDVTGDLASGLAPMFGDDPLATTRTALRSHYLGDFDDEVTSFVEAAMCAIRDVEQLSVEQHPKKPEAN